MSQNLTSEKKICTKCGKIKDISLFRNQTACKDGKRTYCIKCDNIYQRKWYHANKEKRLAQVKAWQMKRLLKNQKINI